jgi:hypothetical protein
MCSRQCHQSWKNFKIYEIVMIKAKCKKIKPNDEGKQCTWKKNEPRRCFNKHSQINLCLKEPNTKLEDNGQCKSKSKAQATATTKKKKNGDTWVATMKENDENANKLQ